MQSGSNTVPLPSGADSKLEQGNSITGLPVFPDYTCKWAHLYMPLNDSEAV